MPRAILLTLDCQSLHEVLGGYYDSPFKLDNVVCGKVRPKNWAEGHYSEGAYILEKALETVRTEVEACDSIQG